MPRRTRDTFQDESTRQRLLEAAGEQFAAAGFARTTVQSICRQARANIAAVNYYFGGKENLYYETIKWGRKCCSGIDELQGRELADLPPEQALRRFIAESLRVLVSTKNPEWIFRIISREMADPTPILDRFIREVVRTRRRCLHAIIERLGQGQLTPRQIELIGLSIVGQYLYYHHCRAIVVRLYGKDAYTPQAIEGRIDHITAFSLAAIRGLIAEPERVFSS